MWENDHLRDNCQSTTLCCANCHQNHDSWSKDCPYYKTELAVYKIKTKRGISFREARQLVRESSAHASLQLSQIEISNQGLGFKSPRNMHNYSTSSSHGQLIESLPDISSQTITYQAEPYKGMDLITNSQRSYMQK